MSLVVCQVQNLMYSVCLEHLNRAAVVVDPVMVSTSGDELAGKQILTALGSVLDP
jgi:hydroxymethylpyrimidine/phosphomethylpyrimidine kinase